MSPTILRFDKDGTCTSDYSVTTISDLGFWVLIGDKEYFVPFNEYPVFRDATVKQILDLNFYAPSQLRWELLDVDVELQALADPESFPLLFR